MKDESGVTPVFFHPSSFRLHSFQSVAPSTSQLLTYAHSTFDALCATSSLARKPTRLVAAQLVIHSASKHDRLR